MNLGPLRTIFFMLRDVNMGVSLKNMMFDSMAIWVQIHYLPLGMMTDSVERCLGERLGVYFGSILMLQGMNGGENLRLWVFLNITLVRGSFLRFYDNKSLCTVPILEVAKLLFRLRCYQIC